MVLIIKKKLIINSTTAAQIPKELPPMCHRDKPFLETSNISHHSLHHHLGHVHGNPLLRQESRSWDEETFGKYLWNLKFNSILTRGHSHRTTVNFCPLYPSPLVHKFTHLKAPPELHHFYDNYIRIFLNLLYFGQWKDQLVSYSCCRIIKSSKP